MRLVDQLEALLFVSDAPAPLESLASSLGVTAGQAEQAMEILMERLEKQGAIQLIKIAGGYQLSTKKEHAEVVANYLKPQRNRLSRSVMEVLAIVAYKQPVTIAEVETIRGVQSDYGIRQLLERRLIEEVGRKPVPGRPVLYGTSQQFLHQFKINGLSELPGIESDALPAQTTLLESLEDSVEAGATP